MQAILRIEKLDLTAETNDDWWYWNDPDCDCDLSTIIELWVRIEDSLRQPCWNWLMFDSPMDVRPAGNKQSLHDVRIPMCACSANQHVYLCVCVHVQIYPYAGVIELQHVYSQTCVGDPPASSKCRVKYVYQNMWYAHGLWQVQIYINIHQPLYPVQIYQLEHMVINQWYQPLFIDHDYQPWLTHHDYGWSQSVVGNQY